MNLDSQYVALQADEDLRAGEGSFLHSIGGVSSSSSSTGMDGDGKNASAAEMGESTSLLGVSLAPKKQLGALGLAAIVFFLVCGGSYGTEDLGGVIPPLYAILGICIVPWLFSLPIALVTAELATSMTDQSGFIMWIKRGWGDFFAHLDTVLVNIVMVLDLALYPGIFLTYLQALVNEFKKDAIAGWRGYPINVVFVLIGGAINLVGLKAVGNSAKILTLLTLLPCILFVILGFASKEFEGHRLASTKHPEPDYALYFSVLLWSMCGYEYSGFLASTYTPSYPFLLISHTFWTCTTEKRDGL